MPNKVNQQLNHEGVKPSSNTQPLPIQHLQQQFLSEQIYQQKKAQFACMRGAFKKKAD
jgi:hypothetical protein